MKGERRFENTLVYLFVISILFLLINGCAHFNKEEGDGGMGPQDSGFPAPLYYDFEDVRLPEDLKVDNRSSSVYRTSGFSVGVLVLEGRVEIYSLIDFFKSNMATDNWKFISSFKSLRTIMLFQKENRWCIINITEKTLNTLVEICVAQTVNKTSIDLMQ